MNIEQMAHTLLADLQAGKKVENKITGYSAGGTVHVCPIPKDTKQEFYEVIKLYFTAVKVTRYTVSGLVETPDGNHAILILNISSKCKEAHLWEVCETSENTLLLRKRQNVTAQGAFADLLPPEDISLDLSEAETDELLSLFDQHSPIKRTAFN